MGQTLLNISAKIDQFNHALGKSLIWMGLLLVLVQFSLVVASHVFHMGSIAAQELLFYINSLMFLGGAGYTLLHDKHVRVDVFYRDAPATRKHKVNLLGSLFLLLPIVLLLWISATPFVISSWLVLEGSIETSGLPAVFILKSFILLFALSLSAQAISLIIQSLHGLRASPHKEQADD